jgi:hydroxymethylbilane synthase
MEDQYDAIILASAGLKRLGLSHFITEYISQEICLPAVGQGALALELRTDDAFTAQIVAAIHDPDTADCVTAERALLAVLGGGCSVPIAAHAQLNAGQIELSALVASLDGSVIIRARTSGARSESELIGAEAANILFEQGAEALLREAKD